mmetsp:Transcript_10952/g.28453  ORF Transcript_10952/g.28453 Transcript_10952/m.28453 type:complete len:206 (+) Transcript_10952:317-934(+)
MPSELASGASVGALAHSCARSADVISSMGWRQRSGASARRTVAMGSPCGVPSAASATKNSVRVCTSSCRCVTRSVGRGRGETASTQHVACTTAPRMAARSCRRMPTELASSAGVDSSICSSTDSSDCSTRPTRQLSMPSECLSSLNKGASSRRTRWRALSSHSRARATTSAACTCASGPSVPLRESSCGVQPPPPPPVDPRAGTG